MFDSEFKSFVHQLPEGHHILANGQDLVPGYRPDVAIANDENNVTLILESERKTERKAFIGDLVKASHFAHKHEKEVTLVIVMKEVRSQTTVDQVARNIEPYFEWLFSLGATQLGRVCLLSDESYRESAEAREVLLSDEFLKRCKILES